MSVLHPYLQMAQVHSVLRFVSTCLVRTSAPVIMATNFAQTSAPVCVSIVQICVLMLSQTVVTLFVNTRLGTLSEGKSAATKSLLRELVNIHLLI